MYRAHGAASALLPVGTGDSQGWSSATHCCHLLLDTFDRPRVWFRLDPLRPQSFAVIALFVRAVGTGGPVFDSRRVVQRAFVASEVCYRLGAKFVSWITIWVFALLSSISFVSIGLTSPPGSYTVSCTTYGSRGQSVHRTWSHLEQFRFPPTNLTSEPPDSWHWQHTLLTLCRIFLYTSSC